jgi:hypothetical protein
MRPVRRGTAFVVSGWLLELSPTVALLVGLIFICRSRQLPFSGIQATQPRMAEPEFRTHACVVSSSSGAVALVRRGDRGSMVSVSGAFGYVIKGEVVFEVEGEPKRVVKAGEAFWEPGGDVIHYHDGNNLSDAETVFVVTMFGVTRQPMLIPASAEELEERRDRRAPGA